jgi:NADPH:quinone reductase-like Zn-dependent oxidoreductase
MSAPKTGSVPSAANTSKSRCVSSTCFRAAPDVRIVAPSSGPTKISVVPLSDGASEVAAIGEGVTRVKIGDRIAGCFHPRWFGGLIKSDYLTDRLGANLDGMLAEYAVFNEEAVVLLPSHLSFEGAMAQRGQRGMTTVRAPPYSD